jgi:hypothetical protein
LVITEHESVSSNRVAVHVAIKENLAALKRPLHHQLCVVILWKELTRATNPLSVHISSHQAASVVTHNYPVRILHRYNLEYESVPQELCLLFVTDQEVDHAIHHPARVSFARVHSCRQDCRLPNSYILGVRGKVGDNQHVNIVASEGFAEDSLADLVLILVAAPLLDILNQVGICVGITMCEVNCIVIMLEFKFEG